MPMGSYSKGVPIGAVAHFAGPVPPKGWLECNGESLDPGRFRKLFEAIGFTYGIDDSNAIGISTSAVDFFGLFENPDAVVIGTGPESCEINVSAGVYASGVLWVDGLEVGTEYVISAVISDFNGDYFMGVYGESGPEIVLADEVLMNPGVRAVSRFVAETGAVVVMFRAGAPSQSVTISGVKVKQFSGVNFLIPDLRGEFLRGVDSGRGVDAGRVFGSAQQWMVGGHSHGAGGLVADAAGEHSHDSSDIDVVVGGTEQQMPGLFWSAGDPNAYGVSISTGNAGQHGHTVSGDTAAYGGAEVRPRNVAMLACIRCGVTPPPPVEY